MRFLQRTSIWGLLLFAGSALSTASAETPHYPAPIFIDASNPAAPPRQLSFEVAGASKNGHFLSANSRYLTLDGRPWFPVMGEFHFSRYPETEWEEQILKMKGGGIQIISTYIFWIHHEEVQGRFDWSGRRDLRRFVELCGRHGMYVWIRVGPWAHGEVRNGGLPDWLVAHYPTRQNDPDYLRYVRNFYQEIRQQVENLFWKDGGPIVGVQIENEYNQTGPGKGMEHMNTLLREARAAGLDAPFYTATGWDGAQIPPQFLPVFGGYADAFWSRKTGELPPNSNYFFSAIRCDENVGDDLQSKHPDIDATHAPYPFLTAEMGGGMELAYHRRPVMSADDTAAMTLVKLGSGVTMYGYYMFQGGTNPDGSLTSLQESQSTGYPNDVPTKSYDFQAPLGEFGAMKPSFRSLKLLHMFLHDYGSELAAMPAYFPAKMPESKSDTDTPRLAARADRDHAFIFINNYQRTYALPERKNFQVRLKLASQSIKIPRTPLDIPSGAYSMWPVNLAIGNTRLRYATAQLLCKLEDAHTLVFFAWPGIPVEFAFKSAHGVSINAPHARITRDRGTVYVDKIEPGREAAIRIRERNGGETHIVILTRQSAIDSWKADLAGHERLLLSPADLYFEDTRVHLLGEDPEQLEFEIFPKLERAPEGFTASGSVGIFARYITQVPKVALSASVARLQTATPRAPGKIGREVALAPEETEFDGAARWSVRVPPISSAAVKNVFLRIGYEGDIARIYQGSKLVSDDFYKGTPWDFGLRSPSLHESEQQLELRILPLRQDAPIYFAKGQRPAFPATGEISELKSVLVVPQYEVIADLGH